MPLTVNERKMLSSVVTHGTEGGWCTFERVPQSPSPEQAAYLLEALDRMSRNLASRLDRLGYSTTRCDSLVGAVEDLREKLERAIR